MGMSLKSSVGRLERTLNGGGDKTCACGMGADVRRYPGEDSEREAERDERPAAMCPLCGKPKLVVKVVRTKQWNREDAA
jgi:hypothetical protein